MKKTDAKKKLTKHDLRQIDENRIHNMDERELRDLACRILHQLKSAEDRLDQNSVNSSIPPSKNPIWNQPVDSATDVPDIDDHNELDIDQNAMTSDHDDLDPNIANSQSCKDQSKPSEITAVYAEDKNQASDSGTSNIASQKKSQEDK